MNLPKKIIIYPRCGQKLIYKTFGNLQGSQTTCTKDGSYDLFYSYHNLQGSQTSNGYLRTYPSGKWYKL